MARRKPRLHSDFIPSDEARRLLRSDTPAAVKHALLLAQRGGRQRKRVCRDCGKSQAGASRRVRLQGVGLPWGDVGLACTVGACHQPGYGSV
jgi:hypothetical protein